MRWLFIEPGRIGDWINSTVAVGKFIRNSPCAVDWVVRPEVANLLPRSLEYGRVFILPDKKNIAKFVKALLHVRKVEYDGLCILSPGRSAWMIAKIASSKSKIGYLSYPDHNNSKVLYSSGANDQRYQYRLLKDHLVVRAFKATGFDIQIKYEELNKVEAYHPKITLTEDDITAARKVLVDIGIKKNRPLVVIHPGARWKYKRWPSERWIELATLLSKRGNQVLIGGGPQEIMLAREIATKSAKLVHYLQKSISLAVFAAVVRQAKLLVANDSAVMHLGAAVGTPLVALFGPTAPELSGPVGDSKRIVIAKTPIPPACHPCSHPSDNSSGKRCYAGHWECMATLECSTVIRAINLLETIVI